MADTTGRGEPRTVPSVVTTNGSAAVTAPAGSFSAADVGASVTGTGIPANTTIASVQSGTAATLSANATASGTVTATVGVQLPSVTGFLGWSPQGASHVGEDTVTAQGAGTVQADRLVDPNTRDSQVTEH